MDVTIGIEKVEESKDSASYGILWTIMFSTLFHERIDEPIGSFNEGHSQWGDTAYLWSKIALIAELLDDAYASRVNPTVVVRI